MGNENELEKKELIEFFEEVSAVTFSNGFSLVKGTDYWIGSDSCEYDDPLDYFTQGSPLSGKPNAESPV